MNKIKDYMLDEPDDYKVLPRDYEDGSDVREEIRQDDAEYWANKASDYAYDPLSRVGFE